MTLVSLGLLLACVQVAWADHCHSLTCRNCFLDPTCRWCTGDGLGFGGACRDPADTCTNVTMDVALCPEVERPDSEIVVSMLQQWVNESDAGWTSYLNDCISDFSSGICCRLTPLMRGEYGWSCVKGRLSSMTLSSDAVAKVNNKVQLLRGTLPSLFSALDQLRVFELPNFDLYGPLPDISNMLGLTSLRLENNRFSGPLPTLSNLVNLEYLAVDKNKLNGTVPTLPAASNLQWLYFAYNEFSGELPSLDALSSLRGFSAHENQFSGRLPTLPMLASCQVSAAHTGELNCFTNATAGSCLAAPTSLNCSLRADDAAALGAVLKRMAQETTASDYAGALNAASALAASRQCPNDASTASISIVASCREARVRTLRVGVVDYGRISASLDVALSNLTALTSLDLNAAGLEGEVPPLTSMTSLKTLILERNLFFSTLFVPGTLDTCVISSSDDLNCYQNVFAPDNCVATNESLSCSEIRTHYLTPTYPAPTTPSESTQYTVPTRNRTFSTWSTTPMLTLTLQPGFPAYGIVLIVVACLLVLGGAIWAYNYLKNKRAAVQVV